MSNEAIIKVLEISGYVVGIVTVVGLAIIYWAIRGK